jgi:hypothetical protein
MLALSAGDSDDLAARGYDSASGSVHIDATVLRLCRALFQARVRIAYGGTLRDGPGFTSLLHDVVWEMSVRIPIESVADPATPLTNFVAAPNWKNFDVATRASLAGLAKFVKIGADAPPDAGETEAAVMYSTALSEMRRTITRFTSATMALGGKRYGFRGTMPGVAEEILCAMELTAGAANLERPKPADVRVLLLGEYGGVTRAIVSYVLGLASALPEELTLAGQERRVPALRDHGRRLEAAERYAALRRCLEGLRAVAAGPEGTRLAALGLTVGDWKALMATSSPGYARRLLKERVAPALHGRPRAPG